MIVVVAVVAVVVVVFVAVVVDLVVAVEVVSSHHSRRSSSSSRSSKNNCKRYAFPSEAESEAVSVIINGRPVLEREECRKKWSEVVPWRAAQLIIMNTKFE